MVRVDGEGTGGYGFELQHKSKIAGLSLTRFEMQPAVIVMGGGSGVRVVGGQVRSGATLQYPTIAAMYFEIVLALGAGLLLSLWDRDRVRSGAAQCGQVREQRLLRRLWAQRATPAQQCD